MNFKKLILSHWPIIIVLVLAAILRFWKIEALTTFGGDQGYDFLIVKRMIVDGNFTLLGPKIGPYNEISNLYLGPAYYYLIAPSLLIFNLDPIGPAVLTAFLALATIVLIYYTCLKFISKSVAYLASSLYALNTFLINQSRAPSNPHLIPFFAALLILFTMETTQAKKLLWPSLAGVALGIMFQLHYLAASAFLPVILIYVFYRQAKKIPFFILGFLQEETDRQQPLQAAQVP